MKLGERMLEVSQLAREHKLNGEVQISFNPNGEPHWLFVAVNMTDPESVIDDPEWMFETCSMCPHEAVEFARCELEDYISE